MDASDRGTTNTSSPDEDWKTVLSALASVGVDEATLQEAGAHGLEGLVGMAVRYLTFPGERRYTPPEVFSRSGVAESTARALWRAMGFPDAADDDRAFTDADIEALRTAVRLFDQTGMDAHVSLQQARVMSQALARIATAQQDVVGAIIAGPASPDTAARAVSIAEEALPALDQLLLYMYRRHLAAAAEQYLAITVDHGGETEMSVGFADLTGFTRLSRDLDVRELSALIERFNGLTADATANHGGRIVKTIGDEVMFSALDPASAAEIALSQLEAVSSDEGFPPLRIGVATGLVIPREGDLFGPTVNLASRLVAAARPDSVLVDPQTGDALREDERFDLSVAPSYHLKGIGRVRPYRLRRAR